MILHAALRTVCGQLAARHRDERPVRTVDDLQVTHDKAVVKRDRAERFQALAWFFHEFDANLGDFHGRSPCAKSRDLLTTASGVDEPEVARLEDGGQSPRLPAVAAKGK